jgi:hypothetical protein
MAITATATPIDHWSAVREEGYVTDGVRLFRVVAPLDPAFGDAVLEDCATLRWRVYDGLQLWYLRLRRVETDGTPH